MRRAVTWTVSLTAVAALVVSLSAIVLTERALAAAQTGPSPLCLDKDDAVGLAAGTLPMARRDRIVASSANFALGPRIGLWWHLREATIAATYRAFWTQQKRSAIFTGLLAKMRRCPAHAMT
jgi:hypothetical protein